MKIVIESIPSSQHRYETWGDWWFDKNGVLQIRVANDIPGHLTENEQFLIALHEMVEAYLCKSRGIDQDHVNRFDMSPYAMKSRGEPGDMASSPYRREHRFAMLIEHLMAHELGIAGYGEVT